MQYALDSAVIVVGDRLRVVVVTCVTARSNASQPAGVVVVVHSERPVLWTTWVVSIKAWCVRAPRIVLRNQVAEMIVSECLIEDVWIRTRGMQLRDFPTEAPIDAVVRVLLLHLNFGLTRRLAHHFHFCKRKIVCSSEIHSHIAASAPDQKLRRWPTLARVEEARHASSLPLHAK